MSFVIDLPRTHYQPVLTWPSHTPPPSLVWLALAMAMAVAGLLTAHLGITAGALTTVSGYWLALAPVSAGLGITLALMHQEWRLLWRD